MSARLVELGWDAAWDEAFRRVAGADEAPARLVVEYQDRVRLIASDGELEATLSGRLRDVDDRLDRPAVGDWVAIRPGDDGAATVSAVVPRRTLLVRRAAGVRELPQIIAANVDRVFVVSSLNREFNPRRIERYVAAVLDSGAAPYLVLNKADAADVDTFVDRLDPALRALPCVVTSAADGRGLDALEAALPPGVTAVFVGSSGVGKSSLINRLLGRDALAIGDIRDRDDRGRHTTRNRTLMRLPSGALLIDTPGMREFQLWLGDGAVDEGFGDVTELAGLCRFRDCAHDREPGCAVRAAVDAGELDPARVASYRKLTVETTPAPTRRRR